jgi:hypothetical protein
VVHFKEVDVVGGEGGGEEGDEGENKGKKMEDIRKKKLG